MSKSNSSTGRYSECCNARNRADRMAIQSGGAEPTKTGLRSIPELGGDSTFL